MIEKINSLIRLLQKLPVDKTYHMLGGVILASLLLLFTSNYTVVFIISMIVGYSIELFQKLTKTRQYDLYDFIAVVIGSLLVIIPFIRWH